MTTGRMRGAVDGDALDRPVGADPAVRRHAAACTAAAKATGPTGGAAPGRLRRQPP
ncbi:hypothetical protein PV341_18990 [Streptomyces sp. PA03-1a]|nr:hypothetical protein [Streptomyces sp. PA03-1a]